MKTLNKNQGFTLIEVMVALFILTIGMLGSTSMMLRTQQQATETSIETTSVQRATNVAELLRASISNVNASGYDGMTITTGGSEPTCLSSGCDEDEMVGLTRFLIGSELETFFLASENPKVTITDQTDGDADVVFKVVVTWDVLTEAGVDQDTYEMVFQP